LLAAVNTYINGINFFNLQNGLPVKHYIFDKEGGNGVGKITGFLYLNDDSIYVYSESQHKLSLVNSQSKVLASHFVFDSKMINLSEQFFPPAPIVSTLSPIMKRGDTIILNGYLGGEIEGENFDNRQTSVLLDMKTGGIQYANGYPSFYWKTNWGGSRTFRLACFTTHDDKIIVGFPASHDLQVYSMDKKTYKNCYAGSDAIKQIKPLATYKEFNDDNRAFEWYMTSPSYEGVFYDKYNDVFYRIFRLPMEELYSPTIMYNSKPVGVIILDSQLNYIGETIFPKDTYSSYNVFIDENGINMQVQDSEGDVERMKFVTFRLKKI
jgi:hypothetical protein